MVRPIQFGYDRYRVILLIVGIITVASLGLVFDLRVDLSSRTLYNPDSDEAKVYRSVVDEFGSDHLALIIVRDSQLFSPEKLRHLKVLQSHFEEISYVEKVESLFTLPDIRDRDGFLELSPILQKLPPNEEIAKLVKSEATENPLLRGNVVSADGTLTALTIYLDPYEYLEIGSNQAYKTFEKIIESEREDFDAIYQLGTPSVNHWLLRSLAFDQRVTLPAAGLILLILLVLSLRSLLFGLIPILNALIATIWTTDVF